MKSSPAGNPLHARLGRSSANPSAIARRVIKEPGLVPDLFAGLGADRARVRFGCLKVLRMVSEEAPGVLYPNFESIRSLLAGENRILQWGGITVIGNLAGVDDEGKIERILDDYLAPITGGVMITAANVIAAAGKIARAKPGLADRIASQILRVETAEYQTVECRNVAIGHAVVSLDGFFESIRNRRSVVAFVERQLDNPRNGVRRKAAAFFRKRAAAAVKAGT
jgi:hypothetical protein